MLVLSSNDQQKLIKMPELIDAVTNALEEYSCQRSMTPVRTVLQVDKAQGNAIFMPSVAEDIDSLGMKYVGTFPNNKAIGKKTINGVVLLISNKTGEPIALLEGSYLTVMRTGALSGAATKYLARGDAKVLALIGTGEQSVGQLEAVMAVRNIESVRLYNRSEGKAKALANYVKERHSIPVSVHQNADEAIEGADIIVTSTSSETPVFSKRLKPGVHINAIGSYRPAMQELPSHVIANANKVVVESRKSSLSEAGDLLIPIKEGVFSPAGIHAELGEIISSKAAGRENDEEITVFKSVGLAVADIAAARYLYEKALKEQIGQQVSLGGESVIDFQNV